MRIVVDTNVLISALVFGGVPRQVVDLAIAGTCSLYFSKPIQDEVERILKEKFGWNPQEIKSRIRTLWSLGTRVEAESSLAVVTDDPDDDRVLECAVAARADAIVSGDHHLLKLGSFRSIAICSPRQFLDSKTWETRR